MRLDQFRPRCETDLCETISPAWTLLGYLQPQAQAIAGRVCQILGDSQVPLGGLDTCMAQAELDLFQRGMAGMRQLGERAAQIMRGQSI